MKVPARTDAGGPRLREALTPMIDTIFLLLIFFVWTSRTQQAEYLLPLSEVAGVQPTLASSDFDPVVIHLKTAGAGVAIDVNGAPMASEQATFDFLRELADLKADVPVVLAPDDDVAVKHFVRIYDGARLAGFETLQFATDE